MDAKPSSDEQPLPGDIEACHRLIASLQSRTEEQAVALELKDKLVQEQAHSVLELKTVNDRLTEKNVELNLKVEKLLQQLFGRKSERRTDGEGQLFLDPGEEATPEVVSALEEAIRDASRWLPMGKRRRMASPGVLAKTTASSPSTCPAANELSICPKTAAKA